MTVFCELWALCDCFLGGMARKGRLYPEPDALPWGIRPKQSTPRLGEHFAFDPLTIRDLDGKPHTLQCRSHIFGDQLSLEALEVGPEQGYEFSVIANAEQDLFITFQTLFERIRLELDRRHIEPDGAGYRITPNDVVRGLITDDPDSFEQMPLLIIDGKRFTWEALGRMVAPNVGFRFKLEIFDRSEQK